MLMKNVVIFLPSKMICVLSKFEGRRDSLECIYMRREKYLNMGNGKSVYEPEHWTTETIDCKQITDNNHSWNSWSRI